jgi:hypothetical protein
MTRIFLLIFFVSFAGTAFSQPFCDCAIFNESKEETRSKLNTYLSKNHLQGAMSDTDSSIVLRIKYSGDSALTVMFLFNPENKLIAYRYFDNDPWVKDIIKRQLMSLKNRWRMVSTNTYLSRYSQGFLMKVEEYQGTLSVEIQKFVLSKQDHKEVYKKLKWKNGRV